MVMTSECLMVNCRNLAPDHEAMCAAHRFPQPKHKDGGESSQCDHARLLEHEKCRSALFKQDAEHAERTVSYLVSHWLRKQCTDPMLPEFAEFLSAYADAIEREEWRS